MPLTNKGKEVLAEFMKEYGKKGEGIFYAKMNKDPKMAEQMHKTPKKTTKTMVDMARKMHEKGTE